jgi:hypothetical protein
MRRISKLALAVAIAVSLVGAGSAAAGPSLCDLSRGAGGFELLDRLLTAARGGGHDVGPCIDPDGLAAAAESGSDGQDVGPCSDPDG